VQSVSTVSGLAKIAASSNNEGNPRWAALQRTEAALRSGAKALSPDLGLNTEGCKVINLQVFLKDHEGATLTHVVNEVRDFIAADKTPNVKFLLAGGNAGVAVAPTRPWNMPSADAGLHLRRHHAAVLADLPQLARRAVHRRAPGHRLHTLQCLDGHAGHWPEGPHAARGGLGVGVGVDYGIYLFEHAA
jgi:hypothetical protein